MIDLKRNLFKIDVRAQKDEEKVFMRTACYGTANLLESGFNPST
nr:exfoliative toxin [Streptococcus dysgalactiae]